MQWFLIY